MNLGKKYRQKSAPTLSENFLMTSIDWKLINNSNRPPFKINDGAGVFNVFRMNNFVVSEMNS